MKSTLTLIATLLALHVGAASAANEQQSKMANCSKEATGMKGEERKAFMKNCLSSKPANEAGPEVNAQQSKMGACNKQAIGMKGEERKKFMSDCLKAK